MIHQKSKKEKELRFQIATPFLYGFYLTVIVIFLEITIGEWGI